MTELDHAAMLRMRAAGLGTAEIAAALGLSGETVRQYLVASGFSRARRRAPADKSAAPKPAPPKLRRRRPAPPLPVTDSDFIQPPTLAQLMAGR